MSGNLAISDTYADVEKLVRSVSRQFVKRYGGDSEEAFSEANEHFMLAYANYDPARSSFEFYVRYSIWKRLLETRRTQMKKTLPISLGQRLNDLPARREFNLSEFLSGLTQDAVAIVKLVLEADPKIATPKMRLPSILRLTKYLRRLGWSTHRISKTFSEITTALCGG